MSTQSPVRYILPKSIYEKLSSSTLQQIGKQVAANDDELLRATNTCLSNLERVGSVDSFGTWERVLRDADFELRSFLVPELWARILRKTPDEADRVRTRLRRIHTGLVEYGSPSFDSFTRKLLGKELSTRLEEAANSLRERLEFVKKQDVGTLVEQVKVAIVGSESAKKWDVNYPVYEPAFVYRLVPVIALRALSAQ